MVKLIMGSRFLQMKLKYAVLLFTVIFININCYADGCKLIGTEWSGFCEILQKRVTQTKQKMKISPLVKSEFEEFLLTSKENFICIQNLQKILPKTSIEILMAVRFRGVSHIEAEKIAEYLEEITAGFNFENPSAFDENTSHIIGRNWAEIDYSGEGMTWQGQMQKYKKHNITNFKTLENIRKFFPVESKLPYFSKIYKPRNKDYKL